MEQHFDSDVDNCVKNDSMPQSIDIVAYLAAGTILIKNDFFLSIGGWVRDKLLGVSGKEDIDIALDNMAGNDFAIALNKWHTSKGAN